MKSLLFLFVLSIGFANCSKSSVNIGSGGSQNPGGSADTTVSFVFDSAGAVTSSSFTIYAKAIGKSVRERGFCWSSDTLPAVSKNKVAADRVQGSGAFSGTVSGLSVVTAYHVRPYAVLDQGVRYGKDTIIYTGGLTTPVYADKPVFIVGATVASIDVRIAAGRGFDIIDRGIAYATHRVPVVSDNYLSDGLKDVGASRVSLKALTKTTWYYVRPYLQDKYGYTYGPVDSFQTLRGGNISVVYNKPANPTGDEATFWDNIKISVDSALWYFNTYTTGTKTYTVNYSPGTPTADDNADGWMRFGSNSSYWTIRTVMHEMNHGMGNGTSGWWSGMILNGVYQGSYATQMLRSVQGDSTARLYGDGMHFWPYGLNQNSEVSSSWDFVYNALIQEAMRKDGAPGAGPYQAQ